MSEQILKNIWNNLTQAGLTTNDFETWNANFQSNEEVQANVHEYLVGQQLTTNDFSTWSNNLGLKKKDAFDFFSEVAVTESSTDQPTTEAERIEAGASATSVLPIAQVETPIALNVVSNITPISDEEALQGIYKNDSIYNSIGGGSNEYNRLNPIQQEYYLGAIYAGYEDPMAELEKRGLLQDNLFNSPNKQDYVRVAQSKGYDLSDDVMSDVRTYTIDRAGNPVADPRNRKEFLLDYFYDNVNDEGIQLDNL